VDTFDFGFGPAETTIEVGDTVTWENSGATTHNVKGPGFFSDGLEPGDSYEHKFTKAGTYDYICSLHPDQMQGTIVVE
jgi:plastocyanin